MIKRLKKNFGKYIGFFVIISSLIFNFVFYQKFNVERERNLILAIDVIDGDTFVLEDKHKVRLSNIDAPELKLCGGKESKKRLEELVEGKKVRIERIATDTYGRSLALVYVNNELINKILLAEGLVVFDSRETAVSEELKSAGKKAREEKLGIFGPECSQKENPDDPECNIKGNIRKERKTKIYNFPGCSNYLNTIVQKSFGDQWFCTEKEAQKAGFVKSGDCFGKKFEKN